MLIKIKNNWYVIFQRLTVVFAFKIQSNKAIQLAIIILECFNIKSIMKNTAIIFSDR